MVDKRIKLGETDRFQFVGQIVIQHIEPVFNNRPLRCPDWLTPREVFSSKYCTWLGILPSAL